jgi:hypothetical protein
VQFRSYVTALRSTQVKEACQRATELWARWESAVKSLGPFLEVVPVVLIVAILAFVVGLLDSFFSTGVRLEGGASTAMLVAASICSACFGVIVLAVAGTLCHSILYCSTSPFQSAFSRLWTTAPTTSRRYPEELEVSSRAYRRIIVDTYNDQLLNDACAALSTLTYNLDKMRPQENALNEITDTLLFLLSPQGTQRSALTAVQYISEFELLPTLAPYIYAHFDVCRRAILRKRASSVTL